MRKPNRHAVEAFDDERFATYCCDNPYHIDGRLVRPAESWNAVLCVVLCVCGCWVATAALGCFTAGLDAMHRATAEQVPATMPVRPETGGVK